MQAIRRGTVARQSVGRMQLRELQERERVLGEPDTSVRNMARRIAHRKGIPFDPDRDLEAVAVI